MEQIRAFIAIELPQEIKAELGKLQGRLNLKGDHCVKTVDSEAMHLTLKFLGNIAVEKIEEIKTAMGESAGNTGPLQLRLGGIGCFPGVQRPRVIWISLEGQLDGLHSLQRNLEAALERLGFPSEKRSFTAHLTLARVRDNCLPAQRQQLGEMVRDLDYRPTITFTASHISLVRSVLKPQGPEYSILVRFNL